MLPKKLEAYTGNIASLRIWGTFLFLAKNTSGIPVQRALYLEENKIYGM